MPELTPERLAELRALAKKATSRPWFIQRGTFRKVLCEFGSTVYAADDELRYIAQCADCVNMVPTPNHDNAAFIAEFANTATDLLDEIDRLRAVVNAAQQFIIKGDSGGYVAAIAKVSIGELAEALNAYEALHEPHP